MKIAVVSDIHGNLPALAAVVAEIEREGVDQIVNLGDILSGPLMPAETAAFLMDRRWPTIAGNHERQLLALLDGPPQQIRADDSDGYAALQVRPEQVAWLRTLPPTRWLTNEVLMVHGTPARDLVYWLETVTPDWGRHGSPGIRAATEPEILERMGGEAARASLVLCGHSHVPRIAQAGATLIVNPGSVGVQAFDDERPHRHAVENRSPHARYAIVEQRRGGWLARLCALPYDWAPMARAAAQRGRPDWAYALTTGRALPPGGTMPG